MKKLIFLLVLTFNLIAEEFSYNFDYVLETPGVAAELITAPMDYSKEEWLRVGFVLGGAALLYTLDEDIRRWSQENQSNGLDTVFSIARPFGEGVPTALLFAYGAIGKDQKAINTAWMTLEGMGAAVGISFIIKYTFTRSRPFTENGHDDWFHGHGKYRDFRSFPSAHSASAFAVASIISSQYSEYNWVTPTMYTLATLTAVSRIYDDQHWASDVLVGSAIGYYTGKFIYNYRKDIDFALMPIISEDSYGVSFIGSL